MFEPGNLCQSYPTVQYGEVPGISETGVLIGGLLVDRKKKQKGSMLIPLLLGK